MIFRKRHINRASPCQLCGNTMAYLFYDLPSGRYVQCPECSLVSVDPLPELTQLAERSVLWSSAHHTNPEKVKQHYSKDFQAVAFGSFLDAIAKYRQTGRLLDVGCGIGGFLDAARAKGWDAYGVDISPSVQVAKEHGLKAFQCQLSELDAEPHAFDVITMFDVIEHIVELNSLFANIRRFLRPGGGLLIVTPNLDALTSRLLRSRWVAVEPEDHPTLFTPATLSRLLVRHKFKPVRIDTYEIDLLALKGVFSQQRSIEDRQKSQKQRRKLIGALVGNPILRNMRKLANFLLTRLRCGERLIVEARLT